MKKGVWGVAVLASIPSVTAQVLLDSPHMIGLYAVCVLILGFFIYWLYAHHHHAPFKPEEFAPPPPPFPVLEEPKENERTKVRIKSIEKEPVLHPADDTVFGKQEINGAFDTQKEDSTTNETEHPSDHHTTDLDPKLSFMLTGKDAVDQIKGAISHANELVAGGAFDQAKQQYIQILDVYKSLPTKDQEQIYPEIKKLYDLRKSS